MPQRFLLDTLSTPLGDLLVIADEQHRLRAVEWKEYEEELYRLLARRYKNDPFELMEAVNPGGLTQALAHYFPENCMLSIRYRSQASVRHFSNRYGRNCAKSLAAPPSPTESWPHASARPQHRARSAWRTAAILSVLSSLATGLLVPMAH